MPEKVFTPRSYRSMCVCIFYIFYVYRSDILAKQNYMKRMGYKTKPRTNLLYKIR